MSRSRYQAVARLAPLVGLAIALVAPASAAAQGRIAGVVRDSAGAGIAGAEVSVAGSARGVHSDDAGTFQLGGLPAGAVTLHVRRLGFAPVDTRVVVQDAATTHVAVTVTEVARELGAVTVRAQRYHRYTGYLAGFYARRDLGFGRFITGAEIEARHPLRLTDVLRTVPGIQVLSPSLGDSHVRIRGNRCAPVVWIDGMPAIAAEFDLDALDPNSVAGIEIYAGPSTVPAEYVVPFGPTACGTILIWSRRGGPPPRPAEAITAARLDSLVASLRVYTADQVDTPVRVDPAAPVSPHYPDSLYRARVPGRVAVEYVVAPTGRAEIATLGIVSSSDPLFVQSVRRAVARARFIPARLGGRTVSQVVRQSFAFVVPAGLGAPRP